MPIQTRQAVVTWMEATTSVLGTAGGVALISEPDGSLLRAQSSALSGSPFSDWRIPGLLLLIFVGFGFLVATVSQVRGWRHSVELSRAAGCGLIVFEVMEIIWIGVQPLELVFIAVGLTIIVLSSHGLLHRRVAPNHHVA